jgi:hypothetical protein
MSDHFSMEELTATGTGLPNTPNAVQLAALVRLCKTILEPARILVGPLRVNSGFRTVAVNAAIAGSAKNSQHMKGQAADVLPLTMSLEEAFHRIKSSEIPYDQLIIEPTWIHVSWAEKPRRQTLRMRRVQGRPCYEEA